MQKYTILRIRSAKYTWLNLFLIPDSLRVKDPGFYLPGILQ